MKDRNFLCKYYIRAGECSKGKGCNIWKGMQKCGLYSPDLNSKSLRPNNIKNKKEKILKKESDKYV